MKARDWLDRALHTLITPIAKGMIKIGLTPNMVTTVGFVLNVVAAWYFVKASTDAGEVYRDFLIAGIVLIVGSMFDMFDGHVARLGNMQTTFGAMYDSILDRYSEMVTLLAVNYFFFATGENVWALVTFVAMMGSIMVSYIRARAEGLGLECKVGFLQRPERVVITFVAALLTGIFCCMEIMEWAMAFIALFANITAFWRIIYCKKQIENRDK